MRGKRWIITGYDGTAEIEKFTVSFGMMPESQIIVFLQRLAARHLNGGEIMSTVFKKGDPGYSTFLEPQVSRGGRRAIMVGSDPHYVAALWQDGESDKDD